MIGFGAPWVLGLAAAAALVVGALHLLSVQRPSLLELPTARFVPVGDARAVARQPRPDDLLLLLVRVLLLLLAGAAAAGISWRSRTPTHARVVVADARFRADSAAWLAPLLKPPLARDGDAVTTVQWTAPLDGEPGAAMVVAMGEAQRVARADASVSTVTLLVATPRTARSWRGYMAWRRAWPGAMTLLLRDISDATGGGQPGPPPSGAPPVTVRARDADDVVAAAFAQRLPAQDVGTAPPSRSGVRSRMGGRMGDLVRGLVRIDRDGSTDLDRDGAIVVHWPVSGTPRGWAPLAQPDSVGALVAGGRALVGPWRRSARFAPAATDTTVREIAWWSDGAAAAIERATGTTCVREIAVRVDAGSDLLLAPSAAGLLDAIAAPCDARVAPPPAVLRDTRDLADVATAWPGVDAALLRDGARTTPRPSWLAVLCALAALALLMGERVLRMRAMRSAAGVA